jgi:hypothetical protein
MLSMLHTIYFMETYPLTLKAIYAHSLKKESEFPLTIKMFEFTSIVLQLIRTKKMFPLCNQTGNVFKASEIAYSCFFISFCLTYVSQRMNIRDMDSVSKQMKSQINAQSVIKYI